MLLEEEEELIRAETLANQSQEKLIDFQLAKDADYQAREGGSKNLPMPVVLNTKRTPNRAARAALIEKQKNELAAKPN